MDELVALVVKKTGLSEAKAKEAVDTVLDFLKKQLPGPIASQIDNVLNGGGVQGLVGGLGGLLGGKK